MSRLYSTQVKPIKRIDFKCIDLVTIPYTYHKIGHQTYLTPDKKIEIVLKTRGYYLIHPKSRRVIFDTSLNPLSFLELEANIINLTRKKKELWKKGNVKAAIPS